MNQTQIIFWCIKLVLGGFASFFAILLWSKTRRACYLSLVSSILISYAGLIFELMLDLGILSRDIFIFFGLPVLSLAFTVLPALLLILSLILIIKDIC